jgi:hypothetical protein
VAHAAPAPDFARRARVRALCLLAASITTVRAPLVRRPYPYHERIWRCFLANQLARITNARSPRANKNGPPAGGPLMHFS